MDINWEIWSVVIATMLTGVVMALAIYFTTRNLNQALVEGIGVIAGSIATIDALEGVYTDVMPDEWEPMVVALIDALQHRAEGTTTEADDLILDVLDRVTDGRPNVTLVDVTASKTRPNPA
ncbi:hypothetical protein ACFLYO_00450 [Chloroflexota bacterium]